MRINKNMNKTRSRYETIEKVFHLKWNRQKSIAVIDELEEFARKGIRFRLEDIASIYFHPRREDEREIRNAKFIARKWILALKKRFAKYDKWFGSVNSKNQFGFMETEKEYEYIHKRLLRIRRGIIQSCLDTAEFYKRKFPDSYKEWNEKL